MSSSLLLLAGPLLLLIAGLALVRGANQVVRGIAVALCILGSVTIAGFSVFGFLASAEVVEPASRFAWQIGYSAVAVTSAGFAALLLLPWKRRS
jgi:hypothetical protein